MIKITDHLSSRRPWQGSSPLTGWFCPGDTREDWESHMQSKKCRAYLTKQGWHHEHAIEYRHNQLGFRGEDFDWSGAGVMTLGCSFTYGIGLPQHQVWPWIVAERLGVTCMNLAQQGASSDRCFRMAEYWVPHLRPGWVMMLTPPMGRQELIMDDAYLTAANLMPHQAGQDTFTKTWVSVDENSRLNEVKNQLAVAMVCRALDISCLIYTTAEFGTVIGDRADLARDFRHQGPAVHQGFAELVYNDIRAGRTV